MDRSHILYCILSIVRNEKASVCVVEHVSSWKFSIVGKQIFLSDRICLTG